jgi:hypothetical protein
LRCVESVGTGGGGQGRWGGAIMQDGQQKQQKQQQWSAYSLRWRVCGGGGWGW